MSYDLAELVRTKLDAVDEENGHLKGLSARNDSCNEEILFQLCIKTIFRLREDYHKTRLDMITNGPSPLDAVSYVATFATWLEIYKRTRICDEMTLIGNHGIFGVSPVTDEAAVVIDRKWRERLQGVTRRINRFLEGELPDSPQVHLVTKGSGPSFTFTIKFVC